MSLLISITCFPIMDTLLEPFKTSRPHFHSHNVTSFLWWFSQQTTAHLNQDTIPKPLINHTEGSPPALSAEPSMRAHSPSFV